jgi:hypothetical protein
MAADYKQIHDPLTGTISETILRTADSAYIPNDPANSDRRLYEEWLAEGNTPDPPDPLPEPPPAEPIELPAHPESTMDATTKGYVDTEVASITARLDALERRAI